MKSREKMHDLTDDSRDEERQSKSPFLFVASSSLSPSCTQVGSRLVSWVSQDFDYNNQVPAYFLSTLCGRITLDSDFFSRPFSEYHIQVLLVLTVHVSLGGWVEHFSLLFALSRLHWLAWPQKWRRSRVRNHSPIFVELINILWKYDYYI
jgi:hypothetical protein